MAYGNDQTVFVEDKAGDLGAPGSSPFWLSPDVDIPATPGRAVQGVNSVQIRVHTQEEPIIEEKIVAEVYVGNPSLAMSPTVGTKRIDPGNLLFRPPNVTGTEPVASQAGGTLAFDWTPSSVATNVDGPGHRCLVVRAFPQSVTPPTSPFTVPNEQHEAQHNIEVLTTTKVQMDIHPGSGGAGVPGDGRGRDPGTGLWWERFFTVGGKKRGGHVILWAFDPEPDDRIYDAVKRNLKRRKFNGFSQQPPGEVTIEMENARGGAVDPAKLAKGIGIGRKGLFRTNLLVAGASAGLGPRTLSAALLRFDLSHLEPATAMVLHGAQFDENGVPEGGTTLVALAPTAR